MSVFETLAREHRLFTRLARLCEKILKSDETHGSLDLDEAMHTLLLALERHEEIEDMLFKDVADETRSDAKRILVMVAAQHKEIEAFRSRIERLLQGTQSRDNEPLGSEISVLVRRLESHFETEETLLWPLYNSLNSRSIRRSLAHEVSDKINEMEKELQKWTRPAV